jgi:hypothetical protein
MEKGTPESRAMYWCVYYTLAMMQFFGKLFLENSTSTATHAKNLETSGQSLLERYAQAGDTAQSRKTLRHVIAIERWGISRLRMLMGEKPFAQDSSQGYYPSENSAWNALLDDFKTTRRELVALAPFLEGTNQKVAHNMLGELSAKAWLKYLTFHANAESSRVRVG